MSYVIILFLNPEYIFRFRHIQYTRTNVTACLMYNQKIYVWGLWLLRYFRYFFTFLITIMAMVTWLLSLLFVLLLLFRKKYKILTLSGTFILHS